MLDHYSRRMMGFAVVRQTAHQRTGPFPARKDDPFRRPRAQVPDLRQGIAVFVLGVQELVPTARHQTALRRHRSARQLGGDRTVDPEFEDTLHVNHCDPVASRDNAGGSHPFRRLVQRLATAHDPEGRYAGRGLSWPPSGLPLSSFRTADTLAAAFSVCSARRAHPRLARSAVGTGCRVPRGLQAFARRDAPPRGLGDDAPSSSTACRFGSARRPGI